MCSVHPLYLAFHFYRHGIASIPTVSPNPPIQLAVNWLLQDLSPTFKKIIVGVDPPYRGSYSVTDLTICEAAAISTKEGGHFCALFGTLSLQPVQGMFQEEQSNQFSSLFCIRLHEETQAHIRCHSSNDLNVTEIFF